ncbi:MAG: class I SAM-dependent methyltransferase [Bryobacteraceae bacterium]|jgi:SAM-dependent methyltransferase
MFTKNARAVYSSEFYAGLVDGSASSAAVVVPLVLSFLPVRSVVDVGCGVGPWAAAFLANGVPEVQGIDGDYVDRSQLRIPPDRFSARDLTKPLQLDRTFDLAVCLEVAEHLPEPRASGLVVDLISLAPCVLFSAAVPGQGGTHHINEQYLSYWIDLFQGRGYEAIDPIRPRILGNNVVEWFYQQNTVMFAAPQHPVLAKGFPKPQIFIHQTLYDRPLTLREVVNAFPSAVRRSVRHHLGIC